tara:strand:+ start:34471 stop:36078 length:1608 start_codon:yes stop_codon:yes gene_type:complete
MKEKKNIDELFKEQFQDFEATPPPAVWDRIEAQLQEKKKERRVIPIWWRVAGVAALLALLFTVGFSLFNSSTAPSNDIVTEDTTPETETNSSETLSEDNKIFKNETLTNKTPVASDESNILAAEKETNQSIQNTKETYSDKKVNNAVAGTQDKTKNTPYAVETSVAETANKKTNKTYSNQPKNASTPYNTTSEAVATSDKPKNATQKSSETTQNPLVKDPNTVVSGNEAIAKNTKTETNTDVLKASEENIIKSSKEIDSNTAVVETSEENKKSIFDAIEENKKLEDAVAVKEGPANRWAVSPNVGPVYYSSLSGGSSIDPMFSDNSQSGNVNLSYGVAVDYNINEKLSVRSGVNNVNLSYATGEVEVASAPVGFALKNVAYGPNRSTVTTVVDKGSIRPTLGNTGLDNIVPKSTGGNAEVSQQLQYYEVPLELKYAVLNKKFGINVIGGMSTLFLGNNDIVVNDGDFRTVLGEANNLNSISFTSNIGLGFNYQLSRKFRFNIEPMFKYQLNPYTNSNVDFKPYYLGVYSGLSFKF